MEIGEESVKKYKGGVKKIRHEWFSNTFAIHFSKYVYTTFDGAPFFLYCKQNKTKDIVTISGKHFVVSINMHIVWRL
jgi:hypothetical protein